MMALDGVMLLSHPSAHDALDARQAMKIGRAIGAPIVGIVENMAGFNCDGCRAVRPLWPEGDLNGVARESAVPILARLAFDPRLADSTDRGVLFVREYASTPTGKVLADIAQLTSKRSSRRALARRDYARQPDSQSLSESSFSSAAVSTESATREYSNIPAPR